MGNLNNALQELRTARNQAQLQVEKLDQAISVIESLNGSAASRSTGITSASASLSAPTRIISAASRRKMALAQKARWAKIRGTSKPIALAKTTASAPGKRTMSAAARRKIAAFQRARWAKVKAQEKKAA